MADVEVCVHLTSTTVEMRQTAKKGDNTTMSVFPASD
jgi:hypothetical protein